eukprot:TRINITY_DN289_c0_g1_i2.p1 TRINITY_DN289_c0_g1~~TRINITY_DN289_c0_g1_i2.p1  ORF type:complete len:129 (-),score=22.50 TRINITY_DN289_c0_g1_i2:252-638(-)
MKFYFEKQQNKSLFWTSARRGRIYLPQEELQGYGISDDDIMSGDVTENWKCFMEYQIRRARKYFDEARKGVTELDKASRWPVWCSMLLYRQILDVIERNKFDNFTKRAYVGKLKKLKTLAYTRSLVGF